MTTEDKEFLKKLQRYCSEGGKLRLCREKEKYMPSFLGCNSWRGTCRVCPFVRRNENIHTENVQT